MALSALLSQHWVSLSPAALPPTCKLHAEPRAPIAGPEAAPAASDPLPICTRTFVRQPSCLRSSHGAGLLLCQQHHSQDLPLSRPLPAAVHPTSPAPFGSDPIPAAPKHIPWSEWICLVLPQGNALTCGCPIPPPGASSLPNSPSHPSPGAYPAPTGSEPRGALPRSPDRRGWSGCHGGELASCPAGPRLRTPLPFRSDGSVTVTVVSGRVPLPANKAGPVLLDLWLHLLDPFKGAALAAPAP